MGDQLSDVVRAHLGEIAVKFKNSDVPAQKAAGKLAQLIFDGKIPASDQGALFVTNGISQSNQPTPPPQAGK